MAMRVHGIAMGVGLLAITGVTSLGGCGNAARRGLVGGEQPGATPMPSADPGTSAGIFPVGTPGAVPAGGTVEQPVVGLDGGATPLPAEAAPGQAGQPSVPGSDGDTQQTGGGAAGGPAASRVPGPPRDGNGASVALEGTSCGGAQAFCIGQGGTLTLNATEPSSGRRYALSYSCELRAGAEVSFILNLHGTMPTENLKGYEHCYFKAHDYLDSHNVVVVTPIATGSQWRYAQDKQYLLDVVDRVHDQLEGAGVDVLQMWVAGHSWGGMWLKGGDEADRTGFACLPELQGRVGGAIGLAPGGGSTPSCDIPYIHVTGSSDNTGLPVPDMTALAASHGCAGPSSEVDIVDGGNVAEYTTYPGCDRGWAFEDYLRQGKGHLEEIEDNVMRSVMDTVNSVLE